MSDDFIQDTPGATFWVIGGAALIWNLFGLFSYVNMRTLTPEAYAAAGYTPEQIAFINSTPEWALSAFAISVTAGVLASIFLLLRKAWAIPLVALSLLGALVQNFEGFVLRDALGAWGTSGLILPAAIVLIAIFSILYGRSAKARGWLS